MSTLETNDTMENIVFVVYSPTKGFLSGRSTISYQPDFKKARIFNRHVDASNSIKHWRDPQNNSPAYVIPVQLILDPKSVFKQVLSGKAANAKT